MLHPPSSSILEIFLIWICVVSAAPPIKSNPGKVNLVLLNQPAAASGLVENDAELQLEDLKHNSTAGAAKSTVKLGKLNLETPTVSDNSHPEPESDLPGKLFPFTKVIDKKTSLLEKLSTNLEKETDYTPQDVAEYIFWTGDEQVVNALNDFIQEGYVGSEDVLKFLEKVKIELNSLTNRFDSVISHSSKPTPEQIQMMQQQNYKKATASSESWRGKRISDEGQIFGEESEADYDEVVHRMNTMNMKMREDSLREIIYRLAREVFSEKFGEHSIQRFVSFVKDATSAGHIPKDLEKSILETMVSALVDSLFQKDMDRQKEKTLTKGQIIR